MAEKGALDNLRDIHLPDPVSWWPLAPGWYGLAFTILLFLIYAVFTLMRRSKQRRAKTQAFLLLAEYEQQYRQHPEIREISARVSALLKRVALVYFPREQVAGLYGKSWIEFLNNTSTDIDFSVLSDCLSVLPYRDDVPAADLLPLFKSAKAWIKQRSEPCLN